MSEKKSCDTCIFNVGVCSGLSEMYYPDGCKGWESKDILQNLLIHLQKYLTPSLNPLICKMAGSLPAE